jgi:hypothetical protein
MRKSATSERHLSVVPVTQASTPSAAPSFGPIQAARLGYQAYTLLHTGAAEKSTPALAAALDVTEQQVLDAIAAYLFVMTGHDLSEGSVLSMASVA